jgi:hypothetical protein
LGVNLNVEAQSDSFILEVEQHSDTYGVGGTCVYGGHNSAVADIDGDGLEEMITGGFAYNYINGSRTPNFAPLRIWNWDGKNSTLVKAESWTGNLYSIYAGDADGDGKTEILTCGRMANSTDSYSSLRIWMWDGETLVLRAHYEGTAVGSGITIGVDTNGKPEIITIGGRQLSIWKLNGDSLTLNRNIVDESLGRTYSVYAHDLDNDGVTEIVTAGYANSLRNSTGQLSVWQWDGLTLSVMGTKEWRMVDGYALNSAGNIQGNTKVSTVKVADIDGDGVPEIVTSGFTYDGAKVLGQLRIWNWSEGGLNLEKSQEWETLDITEHTSMSINDVDGDGEKEVVTSGYTVGYESFGLETTEGRSRGELKVWSWDGNTLTLKQHKDWIVGEAFGAWNVGTGDVDNDGVVEIVTVGCMHIGDLLDCDGDLRVWSLPSTFSTAFPILELAIVGVTAIVVGVIVTAFLFWRRKHPKSKLEFQQF